MYAGAGAAGSGENAGGKTREQICL